MIYVMSDLHGQYELYKEMLDKIHFSNEDTLYILGDVLDRGKRPIDILLDMMQRDNVYPILGNHEAMAISVLDKLLVEVREDNIESTLNTSLLEEINNWKENGGDTTLMQLYHQPKEIRMDILDYLKDFSLYETVEVQDKRFVLVHAGLNHFSKRKDFTDYSPMDFLVLDEDYPQGYFNQENLYVVCGHMPTMLLNHGWDVFFDYDIIHIDTGAVFGGKLSCLCLDTLQVISVNAKIEQN